MTRSPSLPALLALIAWLCLSAPILAQPAERLIDRLLELSKKKQRLEPGKDDDELRRLLIQRYNVAMDELRLRCEDFKRNLASRQLVYEAGRNLLQAELELQTTPAGKIKVLEQAAELLRWYEKRLEEAVKDDLVIQADLLRARYTRLTMEIELLRLKRTIAPPPMK